MPDSPPRWFLTELKRRKVFRVAGWYAGAAFVMLQAADLLVAAVLLPPWGFRLLALVAIVGFPIALVLAWAFELTADGVKRAQPGRAASLVSARSRATAYASLITVIALLGFGGFAYLGSTDDAGFPAAEGPGLIRSLAVLPFVSMSGDQRNEYFSDGITEELLNALAQIDGLRVPARTSSFAFEGLNAPIAEIASALNVEAVLEGSVRRAGQRVRITAQLIDASSGYHLWSKTYDRTLVDIFAVQDEISRAIVDALQLRLPGPDSARAEQPTSDMRAHDFYLLGRYHFHQRGGESLHEAVAHFREATRLDPGYAQAHAGLALTYAVLPLFDSYVPIDEAMARGEAAAHRALALDSTLAGAHAALGQIAANFKWDWTSAERHYRRALELNPNNANTQQWLAETLFVMGRPEWRRVMERALALDPLSAIVHAVAALTYDLGARDHERAARLWERAEELEPGFTLLRQFAPLTYVALGRWDEARVRLQRLASTPADSQAFADWVNAARAARAGRLDDAAAERALAAAERFGEITGLGTVGTLLLAGPIDAEYALDLLLDAADEPRYRHAMTWVWRYWFFDTVRDDPRLIRLVRTVMSGRLPGSGQAARAGGLPVRTAARPTPAVASP